MNLLPDLCDFKVFMKHVRALIKDSVVQLTHVMMV